MSKLQAYAGVARLPFLLLPLTLIASGGAAAAFDGSFSWLRTAVAALGLVALHAAVNTLNEWSDLRSGIDHLTERTPFSGGSGTLPSGGMTPRAALFFAFACLAVGLATGIWFLQRVGWALVPLALVGAICVLGYSDLLARRGLGEFAAGLGLGALPVLGTALVQAEELGPAAWAAALPAFLMTFNLLLLNEFPDEEADRAGGRRNLVLTLGRRRAARVFALAGLATPGAICAAVLLGALPALALLAALPSLLLIGPLRWAFGDPEGAVPIPALAANVIWNLATNSTLALALAVMGSLRDRLQG
jgi:1,4-dihydroxy-2-naphthoate octaprenyltransferase